MKFWEGRGIFWEGRGIFWEGRGDQVGISFE